MPDDIARFLSEDIGHGDITTELLVGGEEAVGHIIAKCDCVVAGLAEAEELLRTRCIEVKPLAKDGSKVSSGTKVLEARGKAKDMLTLERLALNFVMMMSGVATATDRLVRIAKAVNPNVRVACTRKTTPGFRRYEKKAVVLGGGDPHRFSLDDQILIKDNHLRIVGDIAKAVAKAKAYSFTKKVEVEAESAEQAEEAAKAGADAILLDNMMPAEAEDAAKRIRMINKNITVEISGGIGESNIASYAAFADVISVGSITHSAPAADFSMEITLV